MTEAAIMARPDGPKPVSPNTVEPKKVIDPRRVLACGTCRKRKLKCDSKRPKCSTCARLGHPCEYDEVRKKSGPKRGYVKELEARLKQVENLLTTQNDGDNVAQQVPPIPPQQPLPTAPLSGMNIFNVPTTAEPLSGVQQEAEMVDPGLSMGNEFGLGGIEDFNWDMISLGLEEPLPPQDVMDELYQTYFEKIHPSVPMIHRPRFMASLNMSYNQRPPVCLRYIMWAHACAMIPQYKSSAEQFYQKSRKYLDQDEMKGHGESFISIQHAQAWTLVATYEFKTMYFPRAWMSCGRATRMAQLMGLHRQDRVGLDVKQTMPPPKDWIEREERRRTFWMAFCQDRYASIGTGWPMAIDERDILTNLPASDEAFLTGHAEPTPALPDVMAGEGCSGLSSFAGVCLLATLFGRNLTHLHRPADDDNDHDLNGEFWKRHRALDNILLNTSLSLPAHLRLPYGLSDPNIIFANMNIYTSTICLHQAAIFKADKHRLPAQISAESKRRCIVAADQITNIMKLCSHQDLSLLNPFIAFCLYVAARVFVQYLKSKREDSAVRASLTFLLSAMTVLRHKNPLTESFLVQLDVDLEGSGLNIPSPLGPNRYANRPAGECPANTDAVKCVPLFEIRESQSIGQSVRQIDPNNIDVNVEFDMGHDFMSHHHLPSGRTGGNRVLSVSGTSSSDSPGPLTGAYSGANSNNKWDHASSHQIISKPSPDQSSGSQSNQPTPSASGSSGHNSGTSNTSFSPEAENMQSFSAHNRPQRLTPGDREGPYSAGVFHVQAADRTTNANANENSYFASTNHATHRPDSTEQNQSISNNNSNNENHNGFGNIFSGTGFTPGPTGPGSGFTPGPTGYTPAPSGFTPGPNGTGTGMTPINWNDMQMSDSGEWMYEQ
ncbi:hypothetical protein H2198_007381 [Neophaeococcomyces mojaviensis]|uniref:Uncharacterized protein n=1 Tax=Neophaeococcomyces mojaviensis TaxID=3383035 RepID=A0ACC3A085_9EURO|nr:hypothetical protein H2198_007381 [Knufia sp. JES_112]